MAPSRNQAGPSARFGSPTQRGPPLSGDQAGPQSSRREGTHLVAGLLARVCVGTMGMGVTNAWCCWGVGRIPVQGNTALAAWGLRPAGPLPHPGVRINSIPPASTEHLLAPEKLYLLKSRLVRRGRQPSDSLTNRPTDRGASRSSEGAGVSSDAPRAVSLHREGNRASNARRKVSCEAGGGGCCSQPPPRGFGLLFSSGFSNGPFVSPRRPASGTSSVGQAPAVPSACGCVVCGCAPRWGGQDRSVTPAATRYCTRPLRPGRDCKRCSY